MTAGRARKFSLILSDLPPHVDWPDLKDELRKASPNPIWVRVTSDRKGVFTVKESEMENLYEYLAANADGIWPGHQLTVHVFDTTRGGDSILVKANCHRETCRCHTNVLGYHVPTARDMRHMQEALHANQIQHHHPGFAGQAVAPNLAIQAQPMAFSYLPSSPLASDPGHSSVPIHGDFDGNSFSSSGVLDSPQDGSASSSRSECLMAPSYDQYIYSGRGLPVNVMQGVCSTEARSIMLKRLPFTIEEIELKQLLQQAGQLVGSLDMYRDKQGRTRHARAKYATAKEARAAVTMFNQKLYKGLVLDVSLARDRDVPGEVHDEEMPQPAAAGKRNGKGKERDGPLVVRG